MPERDALPSLFQFLRRWRAAFRHRFHVPAVPYGDEPKCEKCGIRMWANYAGYGVEK